MEINAILNELSNVETFDYLEEVVIDKDDLLEMIENSKKEFDEKILDQILNEVIALCHMIHQNGKNEEFISFSNSLQRCDMSNSTLSTYYAMRKALDIMKCIYELS